MPKRTLDIALHGEFLELVIGRRGMPGRSFHRREDLKEHSASSGRDLPETESFYRLRNYLETGFIQFQELHTLVASSQIPELPKK
ncbi:hypothetical protein J6590_078620 [Homalodisca vitripennis]|nr:hypothetical protein J6590_078620 [Homalodisca vitripennis]